MTGRDKVYTINEDEVFDEKLIAKIKRGTYKNSGIP